MKAFPCRCRRCGARQTLKNLPWKYKKEKRCFCGGELRVDKYRREKENKMPCTCHGYHFPHRRGGGVWCVFSTKEPTEDDVIARYGTDAI